MALYIKGSILKVCEALFSMFPHLVFFVQHLKPISDVKNEVKTVFELVKRLLLARRYEGLIDRPGFAGYNIK